MCSSKYFLMSGPDLSRRVFHGTRDAAERALERLGYEDPQAFVLRRVDDLVAEAFRRLEATGHQDLVDIAREGSVKHGWLGDYALYAALCGAAATEFLSFVPEEEDMEDIEFWGWRWGKVGLPSNSMLQEFCDLIADIVLRPERLIGRDLASEARIPDMLFPSVARR